MCQLRNVSDEHVPTDVFIYIYIYIDNVVVGYNRQVTYINVEKQNKKPRVCIVSYLILQNVIWIMS